MWLSKTEPSGWLRNVKTLQKISQSHGGAFIVHGYARRGGDSMPVQPAFAGWHTIFLYELAD
jgi:hypothetical protein